MMSECLFCKIINGEIPSTKVYEDDDLFAFRDIQPQAPVHILIVPKKHVESIAHVDFEDRCLLGQIQLTASKIASMEGISSDGFRVVTNVGENGGQTVGHLHYHLLGGRSMKWPPG